MFFTTRIQIILMLDYSAFNVAVFKRVPANATYILDVGCGTGAMGAALKENSTNRIIDGITYSESEYTIANEVLDKVWIADINTNLPDLNKRYDCIIFSHILEHTLAPENVLQSFVQFLKDDGVIIIALPNVLYYKQRLEFLKGNFKYSPSGGLMDETHFRFFDWKTAQQMIINSSLKITDKESSGHFPLLFLKKLIPSFSKLIDRLVVKQWPGLFAFQFVFVAVKIVKQKTSNAAQLC